jgi:CRISPR/Cas system-associated exonuclease Cas4 (RecB family)
MRSLSKSKLMAYLQCPKRLWLELHQPELKVDSAQAQSAFSTGHEVGEIARRIYDPESLGTTLSISALGVDGAIARTHELLQAPQPIFEAGFKSGGALAFADVLLPVSQEGATQWRMIEVKSSTSVKDYHHDDVAVQFFVARGAGVALSSIIEVSSSKWI